MAIADLNGDSEPRQQPRLGAATYESVDRYRPEAQPDGLAPGHTPEAGYCRAVIKSKLDKLKKR